MRYHNERPIIKRNLELLPSILKEHGEGRNESIMREILITLGAIESPKFFLGLNISGWPTSAPKFLEWEHDIKDWLSKHQQARFPLNYRPFVRRSNGVTIVITVDQQKYNPKKATCTYGSICHRLRRKV